MASFLNPLANTKTEPIVSVLLFMFILGVVFQIIAPMVGIAVAFPFYDGPSENFISELTSGKINANTKLCFMIMQGVASFIAFIVLPLIYLKVALKNERAKFFISGPNTGIQRLLVVLITFSFIVFVGLFVYLNSNFQFPSFMSEIENFLRSIEDVLMEKTRELTQFDSFGSFLLALFVIAVLPAIGEELVFRGIIQNLFLKSFKNIHIAILVTSFFFSAFHLQFYGLVPRMLLGMLFGYLYYYSNNLSMAMLAHFLNNSVAIVLLYLTQLKIIQVDLENEALPNLASWTIFSLICFALLFYFRKLSISKTADE